MTKTCGRSTSAAGRTAASRKFRPPSLSWSGAGRPSRADFAFPGGEGLAGFFERVSAAADRLAADDADTVLAVTHGGVIRAMICHLLSLERRHYVLFDVDYAAVVVLRLFDGRGVLVFPGGDIPSGNPRGGPSNG